MHRATFFLHQRRIRWLHCPIRRNKLARQSNSCKLPIEAGTIVCHTSRQLKALPSRARQVQIGRRTDCQPPHMIILQTRTIASENPGLFPSLTRIGHQLGSKKLESGKPIIVMPPPPPCILQIQYQVVLVLSSKSAIQITDFQASMITARSGGCR